MKREIMIRPAFAEDAADIAGLCHQLGYDITVREVAENIVTIDKCIYDNIYLAVVDGTVAGWLQVSYITRVESGSFCEIAGLIISENHRGQGVGKRLVEAARKWGNSHHCNKIRVRSNVVRQSAHLFYTKEGFREIKDQRVFECVL